MVSPSYTTIPTSTKNTVSTSDTTSTSYERRKGVYSDDYVTFTYTVYDRVDDELDKLFAKLLRRLELKLCQEGWVEHKDHYIPPKLKPLNLKNVRLDGRGWGNK